MSAPTDHHSRAAERPAPRRRRPVLRAVAVDVVVLLLAGVAYATWALRQERVISTSLDIDASPDEVWAVLADRASYPQWNPFVVESTGELAEGGTIHNTLVDASGSRMEFSPEVLVVEPGRELRWIGRVGVPGVFDGEHAFRIEPRPGGGVTLHQEETFSGVAVPPMFPSVRDSTAPQFDAMNRALADEVARRR